MSNENIPQAAHAILAPSAASTWVHCPGALQAQQGCPDKSSVYAAEGTAAHEVAAMALNEDCGASAYLGEVITVEEEDETYEFTVGQEMVDAVDAYLGYARQVIADSGSEDTITAVEQRVQTSIPACYGTSDLIVYLRDQRHLHVFDLKYGKGIRVDALENLQMIIYGWGAVRGLNNHEQPLPETITLHICQPRLNHFDPYTLDAETFWGSVENIHGAALRALDPEDLERIPGDKQCQWCKAKGSCPELAEHVNNVVKAQFPIQTQPEGIDLAGAMSQVDLVKSWVKAVEAKVFDALSLGVAVDGYKLVAGRSTRKWGQDDETVMAELRKRKLRVKDITEQSLLSVAKLEKSLGKQAFAKKAADLVVKPAGKPVIAPATDKRPAVQPSEQFEIQTESKVA